MGGSNRPQQQVFNPTAPAVQPLQQMLAQAFMSMAQRPQQNRNPMGGMPNFGSIFQQLFGGGGGMGANPMEMRRQPMAPPMAVAPMGSGIVPSGSRMIGSAPGGNMPTLSQMMMRRR